ncbi:hypothetical protein V6N13_129843 [Hibiscus sabdariffa]
MSLFVLEMGHWNVAALRQVLPEEYVQRSVAGMPLNEGLGLDRLGWKWEASLIEELRSLMLIDRFPFLALIMDLV